MVDGPYGPPGQDKEAAAERLAALRHRQKINPVPLMHTSKANYYLDEDPLETDFMVEPLEMPPFDTAEKLLSAYMESCHNSFPFLAKVAVESEFYHCKFCGRSEWVLSSLSRSQRATSPTSKSKCGLC